MNLVATMHDLSEMKSVVRRTAQCLILSNDRQTGDFGPRIELRAHGLQHAVRQKPILEPDRERLWPMDDGAAAL